MAITDINTETESGAEPGAAAREHLLQVMRSYLEQAESPHISLADFCALAGVSEAEFHSEFADIYSLQLLLLGEILAHDYATREMLAGLPSILDKVFQYPRQFWAHYSKPDFDQYEINLLQAGLIDYFQQTAEAANIAYHFRGHDWSAWFQQAAEQEGLATGISAAGQADFHSSIQNTLAINTAFNGASNCDQAMLVSDLRARYLRRKMISQPSHEGEAV